MTRSCPPALPNAGIVLITETRDWHARQLERAFRRRGIAPLLVPMAAIAFDTQRPGGIAIPGLADLPAGVMVRIMPGGSFEQVTLSLGILHALTATGVPVWNSARAIERCVDKSATTFLLQNAGIATPRTWAGVRAADALAVAEAAAREGRVLVQKPLFGAQGRGLRLVRTPADLAPPEGVRGAWYLQDLVPAGPDGPRDYRVFVSAGRVVAAMMRRGRTWITNIHQGAEAIPATPAPAMRALAIRAAAAVGADFAGVDIMPLPDGGLTVLEVNSMPAWSGLQRATGVRVADTLAADFLAAVHAGSQPGASGAACA